jgi:phospholipid/cholesterol/gamma-HCH transport system substrate-binding protein
MAKQIANNIRLGIFVVSGIVILAFALYMIGQNRSFWGSAFIVKSRFKDVNGLLPGNNVRFSGIQCGTVKSIDIINDTTIEVTMQINSKTSAHIRQNAQVDIGTEGLMGNKVINILPGPEPAAPLTSGGMLQPRSGKSLNDMLGTLSNTNDNAATLAQKLNEIADKLNQSPALWGILNDTTLPQNIRHSMVNLRKATEQIADAAGTLNLVMTDVRNGKGAAGVLLRDAQAAQNLSDAIQNVQSAAQKADKLVGDLNKLTADLDHDLNQGSGAAHALLKDPQIVQKLNNSLDHIEKGTAAFSEDMEALKHNFLFRGYFRRLERKQQKQ